MRVVILKRLWSSVFAIFGASVLGFIMLRLVPTDPAKLIVGPFATHGAVVAQRKAMGLAKPLTDQYFLYISHFVVGNWGFSYQQGQTVRQIMAQRLPATIELGLAAFVIAFVGAILLALLVTYKRRPRLDRFIRGLSFLGIGTPPFYIGILLLIIFFSRLHLLPGPDGRLASATSPPPTVTHMYTIDALLAGQLATFVDAVNHLILPAVALALGPMSFLLRLLRANLLEVSREPYLLVARSKGVGRWKAFVRHALPNAFLPTLTASGIVLAQLLTGSVLVESIFNWPGVGALVANAITVQDYSIVQTFILLSVFVYVVVNLAVDILYGMIDPRVRRPAALA